MFLHINTDINFLEHPKRHSSTLLKLTKVTTTSSYLSLPFCRVYAKPSALQRCVVQLNMQPGLQAVRGLSLTPSPSLSLLFCQQCANDAWIWKPSKSCTTSSTASSNSNNNKALTDERAWGALIGIEPGQEQSSSSCWETPKDQKTGRERDRATRLWQTLLDRETGAYFIAIEAFGVN